MRWCCILHKSDCLEFLSGLQFRNYVILQQCCISLTSDRNCFESHLYNFLGKKRNKCEISSEATPGCHFRLLQWYLNKCIWSFCGPHLTMGINSTRVFEMRFICPKLILKPVVLLFYLTKYQICKILARVEVRRFLFLTMLKLAGIPFQGYSHTPICLKTS